jgi:hypothetical protein
VLLQGFFRRTLVVPDSDDPGHLFEPVEGQVSNP